VGKSFNETYSRATCKASFSSWYLELPLCHKVAERVVPSLAFTGQLFQNSRCLTFKHTANPFFARWYEMYVAEIISLLQSSVLL